MSRKTAVLAVVGFLVVLLAGLLVVQTGGSYEYTVEIRDGLQLELAAEDLSPETRSLVDRARERSDPVVVVPSSYDPENGSADRPTYPESFPEEPHPDEDLGPRETTVVLEDDGRYVAVAAAVNETSVDGWSYRIDVTTVDLTDTVVRRWESLSREARTVVDHAAASGEIRVYSDPPPEFRREGYDPGRFDLLTETNEYVVRDGDGDRVVRVVEADDVFEFGGLFTLVFVVGALLTVPALTGRFQRGTRPGVAVAGTVAFVVIAVAFVRIVARPPPLTDPLKPYQATEQVEAVLLSGIATTAVASAVVLVRALLDGDDDAEE